MIDFDRLTRIFGVLSVNTRLRLVVLLQERPRCVNALARELDITPAAVSQHLRVLRDADLVTAQKRGYFVHYSLNHATWEEWAGEVVSFFELGSRNAERTQESLESRKRGAQQTDEYSKI